MKDADALEHFRRLVRSYPTQQAAADDLGISKQYLSDLMKGQRRLSDTLLERIGLVRNVLIQRRKA